MPIDPITGAALMGVGTTAAGIIGNQALNQQQFNQEQQLMDIQLANQMQLNQQGHNLQMQMWEQTNYPAQVEMLKKAGLNPALMYGMKGGGGTTTGSQGGGAAAKGNAPQNKGVDMQDLMMGLQMKNLQEDVRGKGLDNDEKEGRLEGRIAEQDKILKDMDEAIKLKQKQSNKTDAEITEINARIEKLDQEALKIKLEKEIRQLDKDFLDENEISEKEYIGIEKLKANGWALFDILKEIYDWNFQKGDYTPTINVK